jgi:hypothetical protein
MFGDDDDEVRRAVEDNPAVAPWARTMVRLLDDAVTVPGTNFRIGLDGILGFLLPGVGDVLTAGSGVVLVVYAFMSGVPGIIIARMVLFVAADTLIGMIPIVGDWFDFGFKANRMNLALIERFQRPGVVPSFSDYAFVGVSVLTLLVILALPVVLLIALAARLLAGH